MNMKIYLSTDLGQFFPQLTREKVASFGVSNTPIWFWGSIMGCTYDKAWGLFSELDLWSQVVFLFTVKFAL